MAGGALLQPGFYDSHDGLLNVHRLFELERCVADGQLPCRWVPDMGAGYGYPLFDFYPPLASHVALVLHALGLSLLGAVKGAFLLALVVAAISMFALARECFGNGRRTGGGGPLRLRSLPGRGRLRARCPGGELGAGAGPLRLLDR